MEKKILKIKRNVKSLKKPIKIFYMLLVIIFLCDIDTFAQTDSTNTEEADFFDLSLEDLLSMSVTSASKKAEGIFDAPSIITTISATEINDFGARTFYELLERSASFYGITSYFLPQNAVAARGDLPTHVNPNILFLLNGRPVRESIKGGENVGFFTTFPISAIQQIEFIRGPGSVLYGSNAYIGVVNVITKKGKDQKLYVEGATGSMNTVKAEATYLGSIGDLSYNASVNYYNTSGWELADSIFFAGQSRYIETDMGQDVLGSNLGVTYKGITLNGFFGQNTLGKAHHTGVDADYYARRGFADIGYADSITDWYVINANITYNHIDDLLWQDAPDGLAYQITSNDMVYELTNFFTVNNKIELTVGGSISTMSGNQFYGEGHIIKGESVPYPVDPYSFSWANAYLQGDYKPTDWLKFVLGGQVNKVPNNDIDFVPRVAVIGKSKFGLGTKLMFGQAFRAPYPGETSLRVGAVYGDPNLKPQKISTFEAQTFYEKSKGNIALTYFNSHQNDLISRKPNTDPAIAGASVYTNAGVFDSWGLELEGKYKASKNLYVIGSYSMLQSVANDTIDNPYLLPNHMFKLGVSYNIGNIVKLSVFNSFYSSPYNFSDVYGTIKRNSLGELSAYDLLSAKAIINLSKITGLKKPDLKLTLEGVNLLDQIVYNPEIVFKGFDAIRNGPGRAIYFGIQATF